MAELSAEVLTELIAASTEPQALVRIDSPDWPVVFANPAFLALAQGLDPHQRPFPDVVTAMIGREMTREASAALRAREAVKLPVDVGSREYLLVLVPVVAGENGAVAYFAAYFRTAGQQLPELARTGTFRALTRATRRIRDLSGEDAVTGLMNERAFRTVFEHDWAVAAREKATLGLTVFRLDDFSAYLGAFGRHGADSCLRRIAGLISRSLQRASDVAARIDDADGGCLVILSHGANDAGLNEFAARIAEAVRGLGLHHPRSRSEKFVTVSWQAETLRPTNNRSTPASVLARLLPAASFDGIAAADAGG